jgi:hypothetical protein
VEEEEDDGEDEVDAKRSRGIVDGLLPFVGAVSVHFLFLFASVGAKRLYIVRSLCWLQESADLRREGGCREVHEVLSGGAGVLLGRGIKEGIAKGRDGKEGYGEAGCTP